jgi:hypothetical protein
VRLNLLVCALLCSTAGFSQNSGQSSGQSSGIWIPGLAPDWDVAVILREIGANAARVSPVLDKVDAKSWLVRGASETYVEQLESARQQARAMSEQAVALSSNPGKLAASLELFFRMESLTTTLGSLEDGIRKYQDPLLTQELIATYAQGGVNRERFREYIVNLAAQRERQFDVMDKEAQRCRGSLVATPPPPKTTGRKK